MILLNYLYFLIITFIGYKWLTSSEGTMTNPLNKQEQMWLDGPERFWVLTFSTGLLALSAPAGLDLMAVRLLVLEVFCLIGLLFICKRKPQWTAASVVYAVFILWLVIGLAYSPAPGYGFRVILKYLYPLLIMLFASAAVRDTEVFLKAGLGARIVAVTSIVIAFIPMLEWTLFPGVFWYATARAINFISICIFSLALFYYTNDKKKNLFYSILFILPCFIWVFRTSIMGSLVAIMAFYFIKYRMRSLPIIVGIVIAGVMAVFFIPSLHQKMFKDNSSNIEQFKSGNLNMDDVNTNARAAMWEYLENKFYQGHEITGSGTGSVQQYMYNNYVFGGLTVPHSDFVQMCCDNGLISLILYTMIALLVFYDCFRTHYTTNNTGVKICSIVAGASMMGVFVTLYSDNVVNYSMATLSMPFGFYGMMLGLKQNNIK
ncbi:O-antigen ligase family protein [Bacteroides sp. ET489]|uniref:O-antigen ligase family protein n=1 Tax=Bacteroides sp. ET489 TaxID=3057126 RepID=UPI002673F132|nr:O-antigen ligase family protein [Bacteroides sp. ET489]MDO3391185.1 O-antigen ligase family protein [Bacteroides sp. ET489]